MELEPLVLGPDDGESLLNWEKSLQKESSDDAVEMEFEQWQALWRPESLKHYLALGWCFGYRDQQGKWLGYFLAQPLLFFRGMTQTLWVEHSRARNSEAGRQLVDLAIRVGKDKRMQKVVFFDPQGYDEVLSNNPNAHRQDEYWEVKTTRF